MRPTARVAVMITLLICALALVGSDMRTNASAAPISGDVTTMLTRTMSTPETVPDATIEVRLRIEANGVEGFSTFVMSTLNDPRSWSSAGFRFREDPSSRFRVVLADPATTDSLCLPLRTHRTLSCQNGNVVALNADRWRNGTSDWDASIEDYRRYMVNHEVGHLIGQRHPTPRCPTPGTPSAVMEQQTKGLAGCRGNAWPLWWEIERAAQRPAVLAPLPDWQPNPVPQNLGGAVPPPSSTPPETDQPPIRDTEGLDDTERLEDPARRDRKGLDRTGPDLDASGSDVSTPTSSIDRDMTDPDRNDAGPASTAATDPNTDDAGRDIGSVTRQRSVPMQVTGVVLIMAGLAGGAGLWYRNR